MYKAKITSKPYSGDLTYPDAISIVNSYGHVITNQTTGLDGKAVFYADFNKSVSGIPYEGKVIIMVADGKLYTVSITAQNNITMIAKDTQTILGSFEPL
ncbi:MAG: hypothetical protein LBU40_06610 [Methanobrevibacter sp.]|jgi:hypothetical protein|nr:hypothetical protein [Methanobrevibacter sp.]